MRLTPLLAGEIQLSSSFPACPPGRLGPLRGMLDQARGHDLHRAPVPAFLLEHPRHGHILVDTGYAADAQARPGRTLGPGTARLFPHTVYDLDVQLGRAGVRAHYFDGVHFERDAPLVRHRCENVVPIYGADGGQRRVPLALQIQSNRLAPD